MHSDQTCLLLSCLGARQRGDCALCLTRRWIRSQSAADCHILDDHLHDVPEPVYKLLTAVGERVMRPLTVILERDGQYPSIKQLLEQLTHARSALQLGRERCAQYGQEQAA